MSIKYIFIVSTPRAGSTLLQSIIMSFAGIITNPETHFYSIMYNKNFLKKNFYLKKRNISRNLNINFEYSYFNFSKNIRNFKEYIDILLNSKEGRIFLEKTPMHLHFINKIESDFDNPIFIHVIREPYENVRSLYVAASENEKIWSGKRTIEDCVQRWKKDMEIHIKHSEKRNHFYIKYEDLKTRKEEIEEKLKEILKVKKKQDVDVSKIITKEEVWKENNLKKGWSNRDYENSFMDKDEFINKYPCLVDKYKMDFL